MNYPRILIAIFVMALVTYLIRAIPIVIFRKKNKKCVCAIVFVLCALCGAGGYDIPGYIAVHGKFGGGDCRLPRGPGIGLEKQRPSYRRAVGDSAWPLVTERLLYYLG